MVEFEYLRYWGRKFVENKLFLIFLKLLWYVFGIWDIVVKLCILNVNDYIFKFWSIYVEYFYYF